VALGLMDEARWKQASVQMGAGDLLVLYTDGITEARSERNEFFGDERLLAAADACFETAGPAGPGAQEMQDAILDNVLQFAGSPQQSDDIALAVLMREAD
jgi:sigma-B regulation protein RsbU (phosphoserine phosphatase)